MDTNSNNKNLTNFFDQFDMGDDFMKLVEEAEKLNKELKFDAVPDGTYRVEVIDMAVTKSKKGNDMIKVTYKITDKESQYFNNRIWQYVMLRTSYGLNVNIANEFLKSLDSGQLIVYKDSEQYSKLVDDVLICVKGWKEYDLSIITVNRYKNYKVLKTYDVEQEDLPFMEDV